MACVGAYFKVCGASAVGTADADALPTSERVNPAAPNAGTAALVTRCRLGACFTRGMVASSIPDETVLESTPNICTPHDLRMQDSPCMCAMLLRAAGFLIHVRFMLMNVIGNLCCFSCSHQHRSAKFQRRRELLLRCD
jgi:hypothetical protein